MSPQIDMEQVYRPGKVLAGKYRVDRTLGVGGFGIVVAATHLQLEEKVAIKVLLPEAAKNPAAAERFIREAKAAVRIRSEHVARVTDVGVFPAEPGMLASPYMVMEYLDGSDLSTVVRNRGPQPVGDVCEWLMQACEAIAEAHALGIIHRDLKPANLFLTSRVDGAPCVKVLDFGISKVATNEADKGMTKSSDVMGSPYYMSPEQMRSTRGVDARSDIWAMGAILYELLAGAPPFDGETMTSLILSIMQEPPRDLLARRRDVPRQLVDVVTMCLSKDPARRYQDVAMLAAALSPFAPPRAQGGLSRISASLGSSSRNSNHPIGVQPTVAGGPGISASGFEPAPATVIPVGAFPISSPHVGATYGGASPAQNSGNYNNMGYSTGPSQVTPGGAMQISAPALQGSSAMNIPMTMMGQPTPAANWGGTYSSQRPSRVPLIVGLVAIAATAVAASLFLVFRNPGATKQVAGPATTIIEVITPPPTGSSKGSTPTVAPATTETAVASAAPPDKTTSTPTKTPTKGPGTPTPTPTSTPTPTVTTIFIPPPPPPPPPNTNKPDMFGTPH